MVVQASKLNLFNSPSSLSSPPNITSLLFEPNSNSLALMHSDSSFFLFPCLSPFSLSPPPSQTLAVVPPPISSSSSFLLLNPNPNSPNPNSITPLFVVAGPHNSGAAILLRFYILRKSVQLYAKCKVICNQKAFDIDDNLGVIFNVNHGVSIRVCGSVNVFAMYSVSNSKIWVFSVKMVEEYGSGGDGVLVKLMKCGVIECCVPVWSLSVSYGYLILGEDNGIRAFALRPIVKGKTRKSKRDSKNINLRLDNGKLKDRKLSLPNGVVPALNGGNDFYRSFAKNEGSDHGGEITVAEETVVGSFSNGYLDSVKPRSVKVRQDSDACFVAFKSKDVESSKSTTVMQLTAKAISIQALSPNQFLILDTVGDLHFLHLSNPVLGSKITSHMRQLTHSMKVQQLAVLSDVTLRAQTVWISDGLYSVHMMDMSDVVITNENDKNATEEKLMQLSVNQAIFAGEKIQDIVPLAANAVLILGQGSAYTYAVS